MSLLNTEETLIKSTINGTMKLYHWPNSLKLLKKLYCQPKDEVIIGSFLTPLSLDPLSAPITDVCQRKLNKQQKRKSETTTENPRKKNNVRNFFKKQSGATRKSAKTSKETQLNKSDCIILNRLLDVPRQL